MQESAIYSAVEATGYIAPRTPETLGTSLPDRGARWLAELDASSWPLHPPTSTHFMSAFRMPSIRLAMMADCLGCFGLTTPGSRRLLGFRFQPVAPTTAAAHSAIAV